jgi:hypothetical protein
MDEVTLAALIAAGGGILSIIVSALTDRRLGSRVAERAEVEARRLADRAEVEADAAEGEAARLRSGIRRHIFICATPGDLVDLIRRPDPH